MKPKTNAHGGARPGPHPGRPRSVIRLDIGPAAYAALSVLALQDAMAARIAQDQAAAQLIARLIEAERKRRAE